MTEPLSREERAEFNAINRQYATPIVQLTQDEYQALRSELLLLTARAVRAEADAKRLDWLNNNAVYVQVDKPLTTLMFDIPEGQSLREAIDAQRARPATP